RKGINNNRKCDKQGTSRKQKRFFFSSRRRHTRSKRDWSSDVCSSDLDSELIDFSPMATRTEKPMSSESLNFTPGRSLRSSRMTRSEERRVGKVCRAQWMEDRDKQTIRASTMMIGSATARAAI